MIIKLVNCSNQEWLNRAGTPYAVFNGEVVDTELKGEVVDIALSHEYLRRQGLSDHLDIIADTGCSILLGSEYDMKDANGNVTGQRNPEESIEQVVDGVYSIASFGSRDIAKLIKSESFNAVMTDFKASKAAKVTIEKQREQRINATLKKGNIVRKKKDDDDDTQIDEGAATTSEKEETQTSASQEPTPTRRGSRARASA